MSRLLENHNNDVPYELDKPCCCNGNFGIYSDVYYYCILFYPIGDVFPYFQDVIIVYGH